MAKTRKNVPWKGWSKQEPKGKQRTTMYKKCGKKCFLGTISKKDKQHPSFPICTKNTCTVNPKGVWAAYIRAKQWGKPRKDYKTKGKMVIYKSKKGTRKVYYKGSRPSQPRGAYSRVARKAKKMLHLK